MAHVRVMDLQCGDMYFVNNYQEMLRGWTCFGDLEYPGRFNRKDYWRGCPKLIDVATLVAVLRILRLNRVVMVSWLTFSHPHFLDIKSAAEIYTIITIE